MKVPAFMSDAGAQIMVSLLGEKFAGIEEKIPKSWTPQCREARCLLQLSEWLFKRMDIENNKLLGSLNLPSLAKGMAYKCDADQERRREMGQGLRDLYLLLDSYHVAD